MRVAILSFLFNWPSTGGGNHHTAELAAFLALAGYEVKHFFAQFPSWGIGRITDALISPWNFLDNSPTGAMGATVLVSDLAVIDATACQVNVPTGPYICEFAGNTPARVRIVCEVRKQAAE